MKGVNRMVELSDIMDETSREILNSKKMALEKGDDAVVHQVGEGRDIMSILREFVLSACSCDVVLNPCLGTVKANTEASEEDRLPESELTAQMSYVIHDSPCFTLTFTVS